MFRVFLASTAALALAGCGEKSANDSITVVKGAQNGTVAPAGPAAVETTRQAFVSSVVGAYDFSLTSAKLASERGGRPATKQLAQRVTTDLAASLDELKTIAGKAGLTLDPKPGATFASDLAILSSTRGMPFDQAYARQQLAALTELLGTLRAYKNGGDNPELKRWAETAQGVVNERLMDMQSLEAELQEAAES